MNVSLNSASNFYRLLTDSLFCFGRSDGATVRHRAPSSSEILSTNHKILMSLVRIMVRPTYIAWPAFG